MAVHIVITAIAIVVFFIIRSGLKKICRTQCSVKSR